MRNEGWILEQIVEIKRKIYVCKFAAYYVMLTKTVSDFCGFWQEHDRIKLNLKSIVDNCQAYDILH